MKIIITRESVLETIKPITRMSVDNYSKGFENVVRMFVPLIALTYTLIYTFKDIAKQPKKAIAHHVGDLLKWLASANTVDTPKRDSDVPTSDPVTKKLTATTSATKVITTKQTAKSGASAAKPRTTRKRSARGSSNTTPASTTV